MNYSPFIKYIQSIGKPNILPNWFSLLALIAVVMSIRSNIKDSELAKYKSQLIFKAHQSNGVIPEEDSQDEKMYYTALDELLSSGIVRKINDGYELTKFSPRITDDILFASQLIANDMVEKDSAISCSLVAVQIERIKTLLHKIEETRNTSYTKSAFDVYLSKYDYKIFKTLISHGNYLYMKNQCGCLEELVFEMKEGG